MSDQPVGALSARERGERIAFRRGVSLLVLTLLIPGSAQLIAGGRGLGRFAVRVWAGTLAVGVAFGVLALAQRTWAIAVYAHPWTQWLASVAVLVLGVGWSLLLWDAWRLGRPGGMGSPRKYVITLIAAVLALAVGLGSAQASALSRSQALLFGSVFGGGGDADISDGRINILLVGADAEPDRPGIRTDTLMVASVSATTGRTVLFSLPRNLQHAPFPKTSPLHALYPNGYWCADQECLLNAVHSEAEKHANLFPGVKNPGMTAVREVVSEILGLKLNYHAVIDMRGFEKLIDALGGVTLDVAKAVPIGGGSARVEGYIQPGKSVHLNGYQALWFARSRHGSSDYERMARQKCVVNAVAKQATPLKLVTRFTELAAAGGAVLSTDIPTSQLGGLIELADAGRRLPIASVSFAPPLIEPVKPDFALIRSSVKDAVLASVALDQEAQRVAAEASAAAAAAAGASAGSTAGSSAGATAPAPAPTAGSAKASASQAPTASTASAKQTATGPVVAKTAPKPTASFSEERQTDDLEAVCGVG